MIFLIKTVIYMMTNFLYFVMFTCINTFLLQKIHKIVSIIYKAGLSMVSAYTMLRSTMETHINVRIA